MLSENDKKQYKSIKAPADLKARVMADCQNAEIKKPDKTAYKYISFVAACLLAVFFIGFVAMGMSSSVVYVDDAVYFGEKIIVNEPVQVASFQRTVKSQKIEIDANIETEISISNGEFTLLDAETLEHIYSGNKYSVTGKVIIQVSLNEGEKAVLSLENILSGREISLENSN